MPRGAHGRSGFTQKYGVTRLVWYLPSDDIAAAITLENKIKNRGGRWKIDLIEKSNPDWSNLAANWMSAEGACKIAAPPTARSPHA